MDPIKFEIPETLLLTSEFKDYAGEWDPKAVMAGPDEYRFAQPLSWQVTVTNTGEDALLVSGVVSGMAETDCARCTEPFEFEVEGEVEGYVLLPNASAEDLELDEDEFEVLPDDQTLDLEPMLQAALLVAFPLTPLHDEDCAGLCPQCGRNLNEGPCDCVPVEDGGRENPFAVLKNLSFD